MTQEEADQRLNSILRLGASFAELARVAEIRLIDRARQGHKLDGVKIVQNYGPRQWRNVRRLVEELKASGIPETVYLKKRLKTPAQLEKLLDRNKLTPFYHQRKDELKIVPITSRGAAVEFGEQ